MRAYAAAGPEDADGVLRPIAPGRHDKILWSSSVLSQEYLKAPDAARRDDRLATQSCLGEEVGSHHRMALRMLPMAVSYVQTIWAGGPLS